MTNDQTVTQADRDAAADMLKAEGIRSEALRTNIIAGHCDALPCVQAFARHRTAHSGEGRSNGAGEAVTIPADHLLAKSLRTSQKALDEINRQEQANIAGYLALRDFPVGSTSAPFPPDEVGPNKLGTDWQDIAAQLREIRRISNDYDLREAIEGHDSGVGDSGIWRDLMDQCERLAALSAHQGEVERLWKALNRIADPHVERDGIECAEIASTALAQPEAGGER